MEEALMPYISKKNREELKNRQPNTPGELQYLMAAMFKSYLHRQGIQYQTMNDIMGALAGAHSEFYRKVVGPYEAKAEIKNGGVYE